MGVVYTGAASPSRSELRRRDHGSGKGGKGDPRREGGRAAGGARRAHAPRGDGIVGWARNGRAKAHLLELAVIVDGELEELAMGTIGVAVRVAWVGVRRRELLRGEQLLRVALLELAIVSARHLGEREQLLGDLDVAHVVAPNLSHHLGLPVLDPRRGNLSRALRHVVDGRSSVAEDLADLFWFIWHPDKPVRFQYELEYL